MLVLFLHSGYAGTDHHAAVRQSAVVTLHLFLGDEVNGGVVIREVVRHGLDLVFDLSQVCAFLSYHEALSGMLLSGGQLRIGTVSDCLYSLLYRDGVLSAVFYTLDAAYCVRMSLAHALTPEGVILAFRQHAVCVQAV